MSSLIQCYRYRFMENKILSKFQNHNSFKCFKKSTSHSLTGPIAATVIDPAAICVLPASLM